MGKYKLYRRSKKVISACETLCIYFPEIDLTVKAKRVYLLEITTNKEGINKKIVFQ